VKKDQRNFRVRLGFYKDEKRITWILKALLYLLSVFLIYDYVSSFYKFYLFDFSSIVLMAITALAYSIMLDSSGQMKKDIPVDTIGALSESKAV
jgi:hypothetical protein